jgi:hypothetical protein
MVTKFENIISLFNEVTVSLYLYILMILNLFLQGKYPAVFLENCGLILISIVLAGVGVNFLNFALNIILSMRKKFLFWYYNRLRNSNMSKYPMQ